MRHQVRARVFGAVMASVLVAVLLPGAGTAVAAKAPKIDTEATVKVAHGNSYGTNIDPHAGNGPLNYYLYDLLLQLDSKRTIIPGLASAWNVSPDGLTVKLTLRKDVVFNDGTPLDGRSVKASLERNRGPAFAARAAALSAISSIVISDSDPSSVTLQLSRPDATLLTTLANPNQGTGFIASYKVLESGVDLSLSDRGAGSTPYRVVSFNPGVTFVIERPAGQRPYWQKGMWTPKRYEVSNVPDPQAQINGLQTGAFDIATPLVAPVSQAKTQLTGVKYVAWNNEFYRHFTMFEKAPLDKKEVRVAVAQAIDFATFAKSGAIPDNPCKAINNQFFAPGTAGYIAGYKSPIKYNPEAAKKVLTGLGLKFTITIPSGLPPEQAEAEYVQQQLAKYGVTVTIVATPAADAHARAGAVNKTEDAIITGIGGAGDPIGSTAAPVTLWRTWASVTSNAEANAKLQAANLLPLGSNERAKAIEEYNRWGMENAFSVPICMRQLYAGVRSNIDGYADSPQMWGNNVYLRAIKVMTRK